MRNASDIFIIEVLNETDGDAYFFYFWPEIKIIFSLSLGEKVEDEEEKNQTFYLSHTPYDFWEKSFNSAVSLFLTNKNMTEEDKINVIHPPHYIIINKKKIFCLCKERLVIENFDDIVYRIQKEKIKIKKDFIENISLFISDLLEKQEIDNEFFNSFNLGKDVELCSDFEDFFNSLGFKECEIFFRYNELFLGRIANILHNELGKRGFAFSIPSN